MQIAEFKTAWSIKTWLAMTNNLHETEIMCPVKLSHGHSGADAPDPLMDVKPMDPAHFYWYVIYSMASCQCLICIIMALLCLIVPKSYQTRSADQISVKILLILSPFLTPNICRYMILCAVTCYISMCVIWLPHWKRKINNQAPPKSLLPYS